MSQKGFSAILVVILMFILAGVVLGGIYYYTQIYQPKQYAKGVISLFDAISKEFKTTNIQIDGRTTPSQGLEALKRRKEVLLEAQNKLSKLSPAQEFKKFHEDFTKAIAWMIAIYDDADGLLNFLVNLNNLKDNVDLDEIVRKEPKPKAVADLSKRLASYFSQAKLKSLEVFKDEPKKVRGEVTVSYLKNNWKDAESALDIVLKFVNAQDQSLPIEILSQLADQNGEFKEAVKRIEKFVDLSGSFLGLNSPAYIFSFDFITENQPKDIELSEIDSVIRDLKGRYP